ncbi:MAG: hypothetical protein J6K19_02970 [Prevotella sp.]|nr:hypothetical protein [Prevotella sp.]
MSEISAAHLSLCQYFHACKDTAKRANTQIKNAFFAVAVLAEAAILAVMATLSAAAAAAAVTLL